MKVLKDAGQFEVISVTDDIIHSIASAARTCYQSQQFATADKDLNLVKNLLNSGHHAMLEFADMTVRFDKVSRGFTHEMVRHRLADYAQESTRYVDESDFQVVVPPHRDEEERVIKLNLNGQTFEASLSEWLDLNEQTYRSLRGAGWKPEDARQVLPQAIKAQIVVKANMREWRHIFKMRCDLYAHWEIREIMLKLLAWCQEHIPVIFDDFKVFESKGVRYARPVMTMSNLLAEIEQWVLSLPKEAEQRTKEIELLKQKIDAIIIYNI
jgi:thymidylate synthase (FAD)